MSPSGTDSVSSTAMNRFWDTFIKPVLPVFLTVTRNIGGEFYSLQGRARQTGWSPNRIDFQASAPDRVKINQNAGSYWRDERGEPLFPDYREFEESKPFLVDVAAGNGSIYCRPRFHEAGIALTLIALAAAVLLWYLLAKPLSGGARNGGAGRPGSL